MGEKGWLGWVAVFPQYTKRERVADGCIHVVSVVASLIALVALLIVAFETQAALWIVSLAIYGTALVATFSCSAGYHLIVSRSSSRSSAALTTPPSS